MIKLHLKSNIDLRLADSVTVEFYRNERVLLTKTGENLDIKQSRVDLELSADEFALWEAGRYIGINVKAVYSDGSELESNYVYRSFDVTRNRTEYWANTYFGDDEPHHDEVVDTSDATLPDGSYMLSPYTAYARGNKITGTMQKYGGEVMPLMGSIEIVTQPTKLTYASGETIDLTGVGVKAYYANGKPWEGDEDHPDGVVPVGELTAYPAIAVSDTAQYKIFKTAKEGETLLTWEATGWPFKRQIRKYNGDTAYCAFARYKDSIYPDRIWNGLVIVSTTGGGATTEWRELIGSVWGDWNANNPSGPDSGYYRGFPVPTMGNVVEADRELYDFFDSSAELLNAMFTDIALGRVNEREQTIAIRWSRPGDGNVLTADYTIEIE